MPKPTGGLLADLFGHGQQQGGDYSKNRAHGKILAKSPNTQKWIKEVQAVRAANPGMSYQEALMEASANRKRRDSSYLDVAHRPRSEGGQKLTGRRASAVKCSGRVCPGAYDRPATHYKERSHTVMTLGSATNALRNYYRLKLAAGKFDTPTGAKKPRSPATRATAAMRKDISTMKGKKPLVPCPTRTVTYTRKDGKTITRRIAVKTPECRDNWVYRGRPGTYDMKDLDWATGKASPAYGKKKLSKPRGF